MNIVILLLVQVWAAIGHPEAGLPYYYSAPNGRPSLAQTYLPPAAQNYPITPYNGPLERQQPAFVKSEPESLVAVQKHIYVHVAPPDLDEIPQKVMSYFLTRYNFLYVYGILHTVYNSRFNSPQLPSENTTKSFSLKCPRILHHPITWYNPNNITRKRSSTFC